MQKALKTSQENTRNHPKALAAYSRTHADSPQDDNTDGVTRPSRRAETNIQNKFLLFMILS